MKKLLFFGVLALVFGHTQAQIKATTESGNTVILYKNGTWEYYEGGSESSKPAPPEKALSPTPAVHLNIDPTADVRTSRFELFHDVSPKMARYFGQEKGMMRCQSTFTSNKGRVLLSFEINAPVGDANRYFGKSLEGTSLTLHLQNEHTITILITDSIEQRFIDKFNQSYYVGSGVVSEDDLHQMIASPLVSVDVDWNKNPESYKVSNRQVLQEALKELH